MEKDNNNDRNDMITIHLTQRDVGAVAVAINAGIIGMQNVELTMRFIAPPPKGISEYMEKTANAAGMVYQRLLKLANDKWPNGTEPEKEEVATDAPLKVSGE